MELLKNIIQDRIKQYTCITEEQMQELLERIK
jgi:hypothetical protein